MRRREAIAAAGAGVAGLLAGCSRFGGGGDEGTETPTGMWELRARVVNGDDRAHEWRVECRSPTGSAASASGTVPAGDAVEAGLAGLVRDEDLEVSVDSSAGAVAQQWRATECRELFVEARIGDGDPRLESECRSED